MSNRKPTNIVVQPIKLDGLETQALAYVLESGVLRKALSPNATACKAGFAPHGFVETPRGIFALCSEGVGPSTPITETDKYIIEFYPEHFKDGHGFISMMPQCSMKLGPAELKELANGDHINLADFIRSFGGRLDDNYENWRRILTEAFTPRM